MPSPCPTTCSSMWAGQAAKHSRTVHAHSRHARLLPLLHDVFQVRRCLLRRCLRYVRPGMQRRPPPRPSPARSRSRSIAPSSPSSPSSPTTSKHQQLHARRVCHRRIRPVPPLPLNPARRPARRPGPSTSLSTPISTKGERIVRVVLARLLGPRRTVRVEHVRVWLPRIRAAHVAVVERPSNVPVAAVERLVRGGRRRGSARPRPLPLRRLAHEVHVRLRLRPGWPGWLSAERGGGWEGVAPVGRIDGGGRLGARARGEEEDGEGGEEDEGRKRVSPRRRHRRVVRSGRARKAVSPGPARKAANGAEREVWTAQCGSEARGTQETMGTLGKRKK